MPYRYFMFESLLVTNAILAIIPKEKAPPKRGRSFD
jgi:hypothetical protein